MTYLNIEPRYTELQAIKDSIVTPQQFRGGTRKLDF